MSLLALLLALLLGSLLQLRSRLQLVARRCNSALRGSVLPLLLAPPLSAPPTRGRRLLRRASSLGSCARRSALSLSPPPLLFTLRSSRAAMLRQKRNAASAPMERVRDDAVVRHPAFVTRLPVSCACSAPVKLNTSSDSLMLRTTAVSAHQQVRKWLRVRATHPTTVKATSVPLEITCAACALLSTRALSSPPNACASEHQRPPACAPAGVCTHSVHEGPCGCSRARWIR